ncbi:MAG: heme-binding domain-containing protein [Alphaproteobacteria bacterium]|nr:heme-binding domain-containing protein [Alphaproteobacteria bacterium]
MKHFIKILKKIAILLIIVLLMFQFFQIDKTNIVDNSNNISQVFQMNDSVSTILKTSCYDCHSNNINYPWYTYIQPVGWWIKHHINEGQDELNFDNFKTYKIRRQFKKLQECIEELEEQKMPLESYTLVHNEAKLSNEQKSLMITWFKRQLETMKTTYPEDSLKRPSKK